MKVDGGLGGELRAAGDTAHELEDVGYDGV
jgi:hypothetical protein